MREQDFISEVEDYCAEAGVTPSTLGVRALNNSRFFDRLKRKQSQVEEHISRVRAYMRQNPPQKSKGAA